SALLAAYLFLFATRRPPSSPLFPYTTLFRSFPRDAKDPLITRSFGDENQSPILKLAVYSDTLSLREISTLTDQVIVKRLQNVSRSEEHTSELQSRENLVCRLLLEKKKNTRSG